MATPPASEPLPGQIALFPEEVSPAPPPSPRLPPEAPTVPDGLTVDGVGAARAAVLRALWAGGFVRVPALSPEGVRCLPGLLSEGLVEKTGLTLTLTAAGEAAVLRLGP